MKKFSKFESGVKTPRGRQSESRYKIGRNICFPRGGTLLVILILAFFLRIYGINWDQNQHLHPDERFLTMVTQAVKWPNSLPQYLNPETSPLNPYNVGHNFFVYGTLPMKIGKLASQIIFIEKYTYNNITLVGRLISALFDVGIVLLVYKIGKKVSNKKIGFLASFLYSISVLPIQLSHFYAVDTFLVFFLTLSFYLLTQLLNLRHPERVKRAEGSPKNDFPKQTEILRFTQNDKRTLALSTLIGISFGLALACKISALAFAPIIGLGFFFWFFRIRSIKFLLHATCYMLLATYFSFRLADPRAFANNNLINPNLNPQFIQNIKQLRSFNNPDSLFPPGIQWIKTKPIIFPLKNTILWGLGLPLGFLTISAVFYSVYFLTKNIVRIAQKYKLKTINHLTIEPLNYFLILSWILLLFFYQGIQFSKNMRYFYPIYPFLAILSANLFYKLLRQFRKPILHTTFYILLIIWPFSFIAIYSRPHSRVTASEWIYKNIPAGSTISCEHWDDCLPLTLEGKSYQLYKTETLTLYDPDTPQKWQKIDGQLENTDYLIMSSNRLWGSIPMVPEKYPTTSKFYEDLFTEKLEFTKVAEITSYPSLTISHWSLVIKDEVAEESFTVYDHPQILIYKKLR